MVGNTNVSKILHNNWAIETDQISETGSLMPPPPSASAPSAPSVRPGHVCLRGPRYRPRPVPRDATVTHFLPIG